MPELDGKSTHKDFVVPFDAHEQVVRSQHVFDKDKGYVKADPVHTLNAKNEPVALHEYPKAVAHNEEKTEPVVARDADHEAELLEELEAAKEKAE